MQHLKGEVFKGMALRSKHEDIGKRLEAMGKVIGVS